VAEKLSKYRPFGAIQKLFQDEQVETTKELGAWHLSALFVALKISLRFRKFLVGMAALIVAARCLVCLRDIGYVAVNL
jgi:hypothetical protein